jgi:hypothetical protein
MIQRWRHEIVQQNMETNAQLDSSVWTSSNVWR